MPAAATSPEELDTLLEDALLLADDEALAGLFAAAEVVVVAPDGLCRGAEAVHVLARREYLSRRQSVLLRHGVALAVGEATVTVSCRDADGGWHLLAVLLPSESPQT